MTDSQKPTDYKIPGLPDEEYTQGVLFMPYDVIDINKSINEAVEERLDWLMSCILVAKIEEESTDYKTDIVKYDPEYSQFHSALPSKSIHSRIVQDYADRVQQQMDWSRNLQELQEQIEIDSLTGLTNKNGIERQLKNYIEKLERNSEHTRRHKDRLPNNTTAFIFLDLDGFKGINDRFGHIEGDETLVKFSEILKEEHRLHDLFGRWGGDEFVTVLNSGISQDGVKAYIDRVREETKKLEICGHSGLLDVSAGVAMIEPGMSIDEIVNEADRNMYDVKRGRRAQRELEYELVQSELWIENSD